MNKFVLRCFFICLLSQPWMAFASAGGDVDFCRELKSAKVEMTQVLASIKKKKQGDAAFLKALVNSQQAWRKHVQAELVMQFPSSNSVEYGSVLPMCQCASQLDLTQERIATLQQWLEPVEEGDVCLGSKR